MTPEPIRILFHTHGLERGGVEEYVLTLLQRLDRRRFQPLFSCPPVVAERMRADVPCDVEIVPILLRGPQHIDGAFRLARVLRSREVGILHSHQFFASLFASPIGRLCGVPVILETPHIREYWRKGLKGHFAIDRLVGRTVDAYIAVSEANARYLVREKRLPERKVRVIRFGCDLSRYDAGRRAPAGRRRELGFADTDTVLVVAARLEPQKGHKILLEALAGVLANFPNVRLVCVGEGSLRGSLEALAAELGIADAVRFVGYRKDIPDWLALADICVLPSYFEGLPLAAIEALACGKPMVATAVDGTPEVVVDGRTGLLAEPGNAESLTGAICRMIADPIQRSRMAAAGRAWVFEEFGIERFVHESESFYEECWAAAGRQPGRVLAVPAGAGR